MKLGFGLYSQMLDEEHFRFAKQCGATEVVIHLTQYFQQPTGGQGKVNQPLENPGGYWGVAGANAHLYEREELERLKERVEKHGLRWAAIENLDPALWYDVLLDGPEKERQLDDLCRIIEGMGAVGIPVLGYNFSLAGVYGRVKGPYARGKALSVGMEGEVDPSPMPDGVIWNMKVEGLEGSSRRTQISTAELWERLEAFLGRILPVAESSGVALALHPDDPPVERLRDTPRMVNHPDLYQRLIELNPSPANQLEYCVGTLAEMPEGDLYDATERYAAAGRIGYVHLRNIVGKAPHYHEVFIDEGDVAVRRVLEILHRNGFSGVIIPDHSPLMECGAPWHAGMAYAMGYLRATIGSLQ